MADSTFGTLLAEFRRGREFTQGEVAASSGLSVSAVQSYEQGRRVPDANAVEKLSATFGLNGEQDAALRRAVGLRPKVNGLKAAMFKARGAPSTVWDEVQGCEWVSLVTNERREIVAWNRLANQTSELDLAALSQFQRSTLRMAATDHYDRHLTNWKALIGSLISNLKHDGGDISNGPPPQYLQDVLESIARDDARFIPTIFQLFLEAPPWREEARNAHAIEWRLDDGTELSFHGVFGEWSNYDGLWAFDWHAANGQTAAWVQSALANDAADVTPPALLSFAEQLAQTRSDAQLSRRELGERSGISVASIAAYERGLRAPSRMAMLALCRTLTLDGYRTNRFMREAGFEEEPSDFARWMSGEQPISVYRGKDAVFANSQSAIFGHADTLAWPCAVLDAACHIVHLNPLARRLVNPAQWKPIPGRPGLHLMQVMVSQQFREQVGNWAEVAGVVLPGRLEVQVRDNPGGTSASGVRAVAEYLRKSEPDGLAQLFDVWSNSAGFDSLRRPAVRFEWRTENGDELTFNCVFSGWNALDPYKAMDLFPADAATFAWLERG